MNTSATRVFSFILMFVGMFGFSMTSSIAQNSDAHRLPVTINIQGGSKETSTPATTGEASSHSDAPVVDRLPETGMKQLQSPITFIMMVTAGVLLMLGGIAGSRLRR